MWLVICHCLRCLARLEFMMELRHQRFQHCVARMETSSLIEFSFSPKSFQPLSLKTWTNYTIIHTEFLLHVWLIESKYTLSFMCIDTDGSKFFFQTHTTWASINYQLFFMCVKLLILDTSNFQHIILEEWLWVSRSLLLYFYNYSWNAFVWFNERERRKEFQSSYHLLF